MVPICCIFKQLQESERKTHPLPTPWGTPVLPRPRRPCLPQGHQHLPKKCHSRAGLQLATPCLCPASPQPWCVLIPREGLGLSLCPLCPDPGGMAGQGLAARACTGRSGGNPNTPSCQGAPSPHSAWTLSSQILTFHQF